MTSSQASLVIGKGGETVTQLRQLTGCLLKLSNTSHRFPGTDRQAPKVFENFQKSLMHRREVGEAVAFPPLRIFENLVYQ